MSGLKQLQEISLAAHPLDKDLAVAEAGGQSGWADYSGVSRTLKSLIWEEALALVAALESISQPFLEHELAVLRSQGRGLQYAGDLTGLPVSNTSRAYPNAAYGRMSDEIRLGYQAGVVGFQSPTYGRLWLPVEHHAGDTVSCTRPELVGTLFGQDNNNLGRYCSALARCAGWIASLPARSAIVRASFSTR